MAKARAMPFIGRTVLVLVVAQGILGALAAPVPAVSGDEDPLAADLTTAAQAAAAEAKQKASANVTEGSNATQAAVTAPEAPHEQPDDSPMHSELAMLSHKFGQLKATEERMQEAVAAAAHGKARAEHKLVEAKTEAKKAQAQMAEEVRAMKLVVHKKQEAVVAAERQAEDAKRKLSSAHEQQQQAQKRVELAVDVVKQAAVEVDQSKGSKDPEDAQREEERHEEIMVNHARNSEFPKTNHKWTENRARRGPSIEAVSKDQAEQPVQSPQPEQAEKASAGDRSFADAFKAVLNQKHSTVADASVLDKAADVSEKLSTPTKVPPTDFEKALQAHINNAA